MNSRQEDSALSEEIRESACLLLEEGPWDPLNEENRSLGYTMRKKLERTYAKNAAIDMTYQVQNVDRYRGQRLRDIRRGLHRMFEDILDEARGEFGGKRFGARGTPPRQNTRPNCGPLTTMGSVERRRRDGTDRKGPEQSSGTGHEREFRNHHRNN